MRLRCEKGSVDSKGPTPIAEAEANYNRRDAVFGSPDSLRDISKCPALALFSFSTLCVCGKEKLMRVDKRQPTHKPVFCGVLFKVGRPRLFLRVQILLLICNYVNGSVYS